MLKRILFYPLLIILTVAIVSFVFFFSLGATGVIARDANKPLLKYITHFISRIVYREANKYNPQGDVVPDKLNDALKKELKKSINE